MPQCFSLQFSLPSGSWPCVWESHQDWDLNPSYMSSSFFCIALNCSTMELSPPLFFFLFTKAIFKNCSLLGEKKKRGRRERHHCQGPAMLWSSPWPSKFTGLWVVLRSTRGLNWLPHVAPVLHNGTLLLAPLQLVLKGILYGTSWLLIWNNYFLGLLHALIFPIFIFLHCCDSFISFLLRSQDFSPVGSPFSFC